MRQQTGMSDWLKWGLVMGAALLISVVVSFVALGIGKRVNAKLGKEVAELETTRNEMVALIDSEEKYTNDLDAYAKRLRRYHIPVSDEGTLPEELLSRDFQTIDPAEFEARLIEDLSNLAEMTGCRLESYKPGPYEQRKIEEDPRDRARSGDEAMKKEAETKWKAFTPEKREKITKDKEYVRTLREIEKFAEVHTLELRVRGRMANIQQFLCGLSRWGAGSEGETFPHLVTTCNVNIKPAETDDEMIVDSDPDLVATLDARVFALKEIEFTDKAEAEAPSGSAPAENAREAQPAA